MRNRSLQRKRALRYKKEFDIPEYDIAIITASKHTGRSFRKDRRLCATIQRKSVQLADGARLCAF